MILLKNVTAILILLFGWNATSGVTEEAKFIKKTSSPELIQYFTNIQEEIKDIQHIELWEKTDYWVYHLQGVNDAEQHSLRVLLPKSMHQIGLPVFEQARLCNCHDNGKEWIFKNGALVCEIDCGDF